MAYVGAQFGGGIVGAIVANQVFGAGGQPAAPGSASWRLISSEILASAGLMIVVLGSGLTR